MLVYEYCAGLCLVNEPIFNVLWNAGVQVDEGVPSSIVSAKSVCVWGHGGACQIFKSCRKLNNTKHYDSFYCGTFLATPCDQ
jgi:hypothetical protein